MSDAKKCDRCGEFYTLDISDKRDNIAAIRVLDKYGRNAQSYDLCQKCRKELMEWLENKKKGEKTEADTKVKESFIKNIVCRNCEHNHPGSPLCDDCEAGCYFKEINE